jgi:hypothetical protein
MQSVEYRSLDAAFEAFITPIEAFLATQDDWPAIPRDELVARARALKKRTRANGEELRRAMDLVMQSPGYSS